MLYSPVDVVADPPVSLPIAMLKLPLEQSPARPMKILQDPLVRFFPAHDPIKTLHPPEQLFFPA